METTPLDKILLKHARNLPLAAKKTGLPVEQAAERLSQLLEGEGALADLYEERLSLVEMKDRVQMLGERLEMVGDRELGGVMNAYRQGVDFILNRLDKRKAQVDKDIDRIHSVYMWYMIDALRIVANKVVENMVHDDPEEVMRIVETVLPDAIKSLEAHEAK